MGPRVPAHSWLELGNVFSSFSWINVLFFLPATAFKLIEKVSRDVPSSNSVSFHAQMIYSTITIFSALRSHGDLTPIYRIIQFPLQNDLSKKNLDKCSFKWQGGGAIFVLKP